MCPPISKLVSKTAEFDTMKSNYQELYHKCVGQLSEDSKPMVSDLLSLHKPELASVLTTLFLLLDSATVTKIVSNGNIVKKKLEVAEAMMDELKSMKMTAAAGMLEEEGSGSNSQEDLLDNSGIATQAVAMDDDD